MRARNLKPGFFKNEQLADCSFPARLLYQALWLIADREGRLEFRPKRWKAEAFPYDNLDLNALFSEIEAAGMVIQYEVNGQPLAWIPNFKKHQSPHFKEAPSVLPPHPQDKTEANPVQARCKPGVKQGAKPEQQEAEQGAAQDEPPLTSDSLTPDILNPDSNILVHPENKEAAQHLGVSPSEDFNASFSEPSVDFLELRQFWDDNFRAEGPLAGFQEYKQLRAAKVYPGHSRIFEDLKARLDNQFWDKGYAPGLAKYLRERTWMATVKAQESVDDWAAAEAEIAARNALLSATSEGRSAQ